MDSMPSLYSKNEIALVVWNAIAFVVDVNRAEEHFVANKFVKPVTIVSREEEKH